MGDFMKRWCETRSRRTLFRATGALVAGAALAACAPATGTSDLAGALGVNGRRTAPPATLEFWLPGRQPDADALAPLHAQFMEETPGVAGVRVTLRTNENLMDTVITALAAGTPPHVARLKEYRVADLGARDALLPLDRQVARDPAIRLGDFTPQSVDGSRAPLRRGGNPRSERPLLGLPDSHQLVVLYWNKDLVAGAGEDPARPPATWEHLRRVASAVAAAPLPAAHGAPGASGALGGADQEVATKRWGMQFYEFSLREQAYCWFLEWVWRAGGEVWADQGRDRTRATLDTPAALRALQFHVDLLHGDRSAVPPGTPVPDLIANVAQGRVGYWMTTANAALTYARTAPGLRFGIGPLPPDRRAAHQLQHNALSVFSHASHPDLAYRLVSFRAREEVQARWATEGAWLPVRPALWRRPPFSVDPLWQAIGSIVQAPGNRTVPAVPEWDAFTGVVLPHLLGAWKGEVAPRAALAAAERAANAFLAGR
jgi:ABC-type glycerol-3-phosphate transport system substrate-binding protein